MTSTRRTWASLLCALLLTGFGWVGGLAAQAVTTSTITGQVADADGQPVAGAQVNVTNLSTGIERATLTGSNGRYLLTGLRPGGPYVLDVTMIGYAPERIENFDLGLGQTRQLDITLRAQAVALGEIRVSAANARVNTGVQTVIDEQTIDRAPTINREIVDIARLTPQAFVANEDDDGAAISIAGQNNEYNSLYIDGVVNNDVYGLAAQGTNGGQTGAPPISFDAIEQLQIAISPYDVTQGGFTGGAINAITRSGTNELHGSIYYQLRNEALAGESVWLDDPQELPEFSTGRYGFRLGGPIAENKAFFFINGEIFRSETPRPFDFTTYRGAVTEAQLESLRQALIDEAGYDPGTFRDQASSLDDNKLLAKIDWNISDRHRLTARHSYSHSDNVDAFGTGSFSVNFSNDAEVFPNTTNSTAIELNSSLGDAYTNKLLFGMTFVRDDRGFAGDPFPSVQIVDDDGDIYFGSEPFSTGNILNQDIFSLTNNFNILAGDHTITVGTHNEFYSIENLFLRENFGSYVYDDLDDFLQSLAAVNDPSITPATPRDFTRGFSLVDDRIGDESDAIGAFNAYQLGFYIQDEWRPTARLRVSGGIRVDIPKITTNPRSADDAAQTLAAIAAEGYDLQGAEAGEPPAAQLYWAPRLGVSYDVTEDGSTQLRAGLGVFTGRVPFVFPGAMFTNNGVTAGYIDDATLAPGVPVPFIPDPNEQLTAEDFGRDVIPSGELDLFAEDFRYPRVFRTSAGVDQQLPYGFLFTLEGQYTKTIDNILVHNVNLMPQNDQLDGPDDRPVYNYGANFFGELDYEPIDDQYGAILLVSNTDEGYTYDISASLTKNFFDDVLTTRLAYTYGDAYAVNDGTSDQIWSVWRFNSNVRGLNDLELYRSDFSIGHRVLGAASFRKEFLNNLATTISAVYTGESGRPFSYIIGGFTTGMVGEPSGSEALFYVPTEAELSSGAFVMETAEQADALEAYIQNNEYLRGRRGQYTEGNADRAPFENIIDVHLSQELFGNIFGRRNTVELTLDIFNFTNWLNDDWGRRYNVGFRTVPVVNFEGFVAGGGPTGVGTGDLTPVYSFDVDTPTIDDYWDDEILDFGTYGSRWLMQFGARYTF